MLTIVLDHRPQPLCKYLPIVDGYNIRGIPSQMLTSGNFSKYVLLGLFELALALRHLDFTGCLSWPGT